LLFNPHHLLEACHFANEGEGSGIPAKIPSINEFIQRLKKSQENDGLKK